MIIRDEAHARQLAAEGKLTETDADAVADFADFLHEMSKLGGQRPAARCLLCMRPLPHTEPEARVCPNR